VTQPASTPAVTRAELAELHRRCSNWGRWGERDQQGALNHVTPPKRVAAAALVRAGRCVGMARPLATEPALDNPSPALHHMIGTGAEGWGGDFFAVAPHGYATSHVDALCHIFHEGRLYNGYSAERVTAHGALELSIDALRHGVVTRGVLLDVPRLRGVAWLEPGEPILPEELLRAEARAGVRVEPGDLLFVRTGRWACRAARGDWNPRERLAGLHARCLPWLHERGVAGLGCDGVSDVIPSGLEGAGLPIHSVAIVAMGLHLLDNLDLEAVGEACAELGRAAFLAVVAPLVIARGTASPANPIAVF
jgi:kynurenine formamidase